MPWPNAHFVGGCVDDDADVLSPSSDDDDDDDDGGGASAFDCTTIGGTGTPPLIGGFVVGAGVWGGGDVVGNGCGGAGDFGGVIGCLIGLPGGGGGPLTASGRWWNAAILGGSDGRSGALPVMAVPAACDSFNVIGTAAMPVFWIGSAQVPADTGNSNGVSRPPPVVLAGGIVGMPMPAPPFAGASFTGGTVPVELDTGGGPERAATDDSGGGVGGEP